MIRVLYNMRTIIAISLLFLCFDFLVVVSARTFEYEEQYQTALSFEKNYVSHQNLDDWSVFTLSRADALTKQQKETYLADLKSLLEEKQGVLSRNRATEYSRKVLAVTALGVDANDVYGYSLIEPLACYDFAVQQGIYGGVYTLLALDCGDYEVPAVPAGYQQTTRDAMISYLLSRQLSDGGWAVSGKYADPDTTAVVVSALTPYYGEKPEVTTALDKGVNKLSTMMSNTGAYLSYGAANTESTAQVLVAMATFGIPLEQEAFIKEEHTILDGLFSFQLADGSFVHTVDSGYNQMATEQALYAMTALRRMQAGKVTLYNMEDVKKDTSASGERKEIDLEGLWAEFKEEPLPEQTQGTSPKQEIMPEPEQESKSQFAELEKKHNRDDNLQEGTGQNSLMKYQTAFVKELLKVPTERKLYRKEPKAIKNMYRLSKHKQATKIDRKRLKKAKVKEETMFLFPSKKQDEIALLVEQGVSFTVKKKGFSAPLLLEQEVGLEDGDYVLCQYVDADTKPRALAKVWVKKGILAVTIKEPGHYFVGKRVRNSSVSELRREEPESVEEDKQKNDMAGVLEKASGKVDDIIGQSEDKRTLEGTEKIRQYWWIALFLIIGTMIGCGWICRAGKKK